MSETKTGKFYLECRSTGRGASTTMNGDVFGESRTGNHWSEVKEVSIGDTIKIVDISNSGKHNCQILRVVSVSPEVKTEVIEKVDQDFCPVCGDIAR